MSSVNTGLQSLGYKFSTPLQADYLNTFMAGLSGPGLVTRPKFELRTTSTGADVTINQFSLLLVPTDKEASYKDEDGNTPIHKIVKVTTSALVTLSITPADVAIGFTYSFANQGVTQSQWYGEFVTLDPIDIRTFEGIIIATCQSYTDSATGSKSYSVTTHGADISDALLISEGWNPLKWLSVISPRRTENGVINKLEVRRHNNPYSGYISGHQGCVYFNGLQYTMDTDVDEYTNPEGIRGFMPGNYYLFNLQSDGFKLCDYGNALPITKQEGGVFAIVDATQVNQRTNAGSFVNRLKISPVEAENANCYLDGDTIMIK